MQTYSNYCLQTISTPSLKHRHLQVRWISFWRYWQQIKIRHKILSRLALTTWTWIWRKSFHWWTRAILLRFSSCRTYFSRWLTRPRRSSINTPCSSRTCNSCLKCLEKQTLHRSSPLLCSFATYKCRQLSLHLSSLSPWRVTLSFRTRTTLNCRRPRPPRSPLSSQTSLWTQLWLWSQMRSSRPQPVSALTRRISLRTFRRATSSHQAWDLCPRSAILTADHNRSRDHVSMSLQSPQRTYKSRAMVLNSSSREPRCSSNIHSLLVYQFGSKAWWRSILICTIMRLTVPTCLKSTRKSQSQLHPSGKWRLWLKQLLTCLMCRHKS